MEGVTLNWGTEWTCSSTEVRYLVLGGELPSVILPFIRVLSPEHPTASFLPPPACVAAGSKDCSFLRLPATRCPPSSSPHSFFHLQRPTAPARAESSHRDGRPSFLQ